MISQVFYSVVHLPYTAMTPELTQDYDERTSLNSFRFTFSIGGSILSLILSKIVFSVISDRASQYLVLAAVCTVISVLALYGCVYGTRDRVLAAETQTAAIDCTSDIRLDATHKATTTISKNHAKIVVESLNVKGMMS